MKIDRDTPCELYSWYETRRIIAERFVVFCLAFLRRLWRAAFGFRSVWLMLRGGESLGFSISSQKLHMPSTFLCFWLAPSQFPLWISPLSVFFFFVYDPHSSCWWLCMLHAAAGTQLHRSVAQLAVFRTCLEQPPLQDHRPWWRAAEPSFGSFPFDMGLLSPDTPTTPSPPLLSSRVFLWNKGKLPEGGIHHSFGPGR